MPAEEVFILKVELDNKQATARSAELENELISLRKTNKELNDSFKRGEINQEQYAKAITDNRREIKQLRGEQRAYEKVATASENSVDGLRAKLAQLTRESNRLDLNSEEFKNLENQIKDVNGEISKIEQRRGDFRRNVGNYGSAIQPLTGQFGQLGSALQGAIGPAAIATVAAAGIAELFKLQQRVEATRRQVSLLTGATGAELSSVTASIQAISSTFGEDFNETLQSANAIAKGFNITLEESAELLTQGFAAGADSTDELLSITREYSGLLNEAGLNAEQSFSIITQTVKQGIFSDKGIDAIKEGLLRIREFTPATRDALDAIGLSSTEIARQLEAGEIGVFDVIQRVSARLDELPPQSAKVGTAIADIFGGPGEDAGLAYLKTLQDINLDFDQVIENSGEFANTQLRIANATRDLELIFNQTLGGADGLLDQLKAASLELLVEGIQGIANGVVSIINFFRELFNESIVFRGAINILRLQFDNLVDSAKFLFELLVDGFSSTGELIKAVFTGDFAAIPGIIKDRFNEIVEDSKEFGKDVAENFVSAVESTIKSEPLDPIVLFNEDVTETAPMAAGMEAGRNFTAGVVQGITEQRNSLRAALEATILENEGLNRTRFEAELQLLELERQIALDNERLTNGEKLLIEAQFRKDKQDLINEFNDLALQELDERNAERNSKLQEQADRELAIEKSQQEASKTIADETLSSVNQLTNAIVENTEEQSAARDAAVAIQKAAAAAEIGLNLEQELAANAIAGAKLSASGAPVTIPLGVTYTTTRNVLAIGRAALSLAKVAGIFDDGGVVEFANGGLAFEGGFINPQGGMITGRSHSQGGVKFAMGNRIGEADGRKGEAYIVNTAHNPMLKKLASDLNVMGGGRAFYDRGGVVKFQSGGIDPVIRDVSLQSDREFFDRQEFAEVIRSLPNPIVLVDDIDDGLNTKTEVEDAATI